VKFITVFLSTAVEVPKKQSFNRKQPETEKPRNTAQHNRTRCPPKKQRTSTRANSVFRQLKLSSQKSRAQSKTQPQSCRAPTGCELHISMFPHNSKSSEVYPACNRQDAERYQGSSFYNKCSDCFCKTILCFPHGGDARSILQRATGTSAERRKRASLLRPAHLTLPIRKA
jgi:hypothetical protein